LGGEHPVWRLSAAPRGDSEEKGRRLEEQTVIPVVAGGKVEMPAKRLQENKFRGWPVFQIEVVHFWTFGNGAFEEARIRLFPTSPTGARKGPV
jgi:hypothetical protein